MVQQKLSSLPDFWGFLQQTLARMELDAARVTSDEQMNDLLIKWLDEETGIIREIKNHPIFLAAKPNAQRVFTEMVKNRLYQIEETWREIWRSLYESGASGSAS